ncbi:AAA family ATPase [Anaerosporobacter faecicola]|uniref:AAA family ATPase n=1 Tax=Anaerosporobacter faecicola TaxID=2718714 RepID=UPI00143B2AD1|nr:MoxR family ATPase [Anaerosporobacter faecicola]
MEQNEEYQNVQKLKENMERVILGKSAVIDLVLTALLAEGHILLEDMPGTGKTMLAKSLATSLQLAFSRIQFTPELLPSDVTGLNIYNRKTGDFEFHKGPVFCNILLADEINRATPRTQSSLLECMEEKQITVDGVTRKLEEPFFVIATQNPIETAGTFPLPEAQLDRFLMKLSMGTMTGEEEEAMLFRFLEGNPLQQLHSVISKEQLLAMRGKVKEVFVHKELITYISNIAQATRKQKDILVGISPRGSLALLRSVQAYAYMQGRNYVVPEDIKEIAPYVCAHRLLLQGGYIERGADVKCMQSVLEQVNVPTEEWSR